jgi:hypothetical protein
MRIQKRIDQNRRDFTAIYECEACGATKRGYGYDDANFHENVIPNMVCESCGATSGKVTSHAIVPAGVVL